MTNQPTEIAIVGGGMVGGALALGLAQHGFTVTAVSYTHLRRSSHHARHSHSDRAG